MQNAIFGNGRLGLEAISKSDELFVAKRLATFMRYTYSLGKQSLGPELIEVQLVQELYDELRKQLVGMGLLPPSVGASKQVILFYSDKHDLMILPNGALFMSECLLEEVLAAGGLEGLTFVILHELSHLSKSHLRGNLMETLKFGDLKR